LIIVRFEVPQITPTPKGFKNLHRPAYMCGGLINHFHNDRFLYMSETYPQDANLIISVLYHHLYYQLLLGTTRSKTLHIQMDNCAGQNKNRYFMAFCSFLVSIGWFDQVHLSFLLTGRTNLI
jgi:hypothetical protein